MDDESLASGTDSTAMASIVPIEGVSPDDKADKVEGDSVSGNEACAEPQEELSPEAQAKMKRRYYLS